MSEHPSSPNQNRRFSNNSQKMGLKDIPSTAHESYSSVFDQRDEKMRIALCEAMEENEFLRERVVELEALLVEAQEKIEYLERR